ncbi:MAG: cysteine desulfurase family protein [Patescibacteria group bacterium]|jgi:cysteine desulfurase
MSDDETIYLDYAASNPVDPRVAAVFGEAGLQVGNPSAIHACGRRSREIIDRARRQVAGLIGAELAQIVFTSGATESNNLALLGSCLPLSKKFPGRRLRILTSPLEHSSVRSVLERLAADHDFLIDELPVASSGSVDAGAAAGLITADTVLVSLMWANNILGAVQPVAEIGKLIAAERQRRGPADPPVLFFSDAVQAVSRLRVRPLEVGVDLLSFSSHKMYGPKGSGVLFVRDPKLLDPLVLGGGQENGLRSGTENLAGIAACGRAAEILAAERNQDQRRAIALSHHLLEGLRSLPSGWRVLNDAPETLVEFVFVQSPRFRGDELALRLDAAGLAVSAGSACDAGKRAASPVLAAVYGEKAAQQGGVRISFGRFTRDEDLDRLIAALRILSAGR